MSGEVEKDKLAGLSETPAVRDRASLPCYGYGTEKASIHRAPDLSEALLHLSL